MKMQLKYQKLKKLNNDTCSNQKLDCRNDNACVASTKGMFESKIWMLNSLWSFSSYLI